MQLVLDLAGDPKVALSSFSPAVRVGPNVRMFRLPASANRSCAGVSQSKWALWNILKSTRAQRVFGEGTTRHWHLLGNRVARTSLKGTDHCSSGARGQGRYPALVIASLGANRKEKRDGRITARVLFDGTNGLEVNKRTRVRDQERATVAADLKRSMRAKAARGEKTFAVTANVTEAHRQVPIHPQDWRLLGVPSTFRRRRFC